MLPYTTRMRSKVLRGCDIGVNRLSDLTKLIPCTWLRLTRSCLSSDADQKTHESEVIFRPHYVVYKECRMWSSHRPNMCSEDSTLSAKK